MNNYEKIYPLLNFIENVQINKNINPYTELKYYSNDYEKSFLYCFFDFFNTKYNKTDFLLNYENFKNSFFDHLLKNCNLDYLKDDLKNKKIYKKSIKKLISNVFKINIKIFNKNKEMIEFYQNEKYPNICLNLVFDKKFELC